MNVQYTLLEVGTGRAGHRGPRVSSKYCRVGSKNIISGRAGPSSSLNF